MYGFSDEVRLKYEKLYSTILHASGIQVLFLNKS